MRLCAVGCCGASGVIMGIPPLLPGVEAVPPILSPIYHSCAIRRRDVEHLVCYCDLVVHADVSGNRWEKRGLDQRSHTRVLCAVRMTPLVRTGTLCHKYRNDAGLLPLDRDARYVIIEVCEVIEPRWQKRR